MMGVSGTDMAIFYDRDSQKKLGIAVASFYVLRQLSIFNLMFLMFLFFSGKKYYEDMKEGTKRHHGLEQ